MSLALIAIATLMGAFIHLLILLSAIEVLLEHPCYQVFENDDKVEVCAIINSSLECPVSFPFEVFLTTSNGTAGIFCIC